MLAFCKPPASNEFNVFVIFEVCLTGVLAISCKPLTDRGLLGFFVLGLLAALMIILLLLMLWIFTGHSQLIFPEDRPSSHYLLLISFATAAPLHFLNLYSYNNVRRVIATAMVLGALFTLYNSCGYLDLNQIIVEGVVAQAGIIIWLILDVLFGLFSLIFDVTLSYSIHDMRTNLELELALPTSTRHAGSCLYVWTRRGRFHLKLSLLRAAEALERHSDNALRRNTRHLLELVRHLIDLPSTGHSSGVQLSDFETDSRIASSYILSQTLWAAFQQEGRLEDLHECLDCLRKALALCPRDEDPSSVRALNSDHSLPDAIAVNRYTYVSYALARTLNLAFAETGRMELLDLAVTHLREELSYFNAQNPNQNSFRPSFMHCLASTYMLYNRTKDIETAVGLCEAILLLPSLALDSQEHFSAVLMRVQGLDALEQTSSGWESEAPSDGHGILEACRALREALQSGLAPSRRMSANGWAQLCDTLCSRSPEDVEEAIECGRRALAICDSGGGDMDSMRFRTLVSLSRALLDPSRPCFTSGEDGAAAQARAESTKLLRTAQVYLSGDDDPRWALLWNEHSRTLVLPRDIDEVVALLSRSAQHSPALMRVRLNAAYMWTSAVQTCQHRHSSTLRAYETYIDLLDQHLMSMPSLDEQRTTLGSVPGLPTLGLDAAAAAIDVGEHAKAVELFERGRGILWARMRGYRHTLSELEGPRPELARKFLSINRELEAHAVSAQLREQAHLTDIDLSHLRANPAQPIPVNEQSVHRNISRQRELIRERQAIVREIRQVDGFEYFLRPTPFSELKGAASEGPMIIVNVSRIRCDAMVISSALESPCIIPLSDKLFTAIHSLSIEMKSAVRAVRSQREVIEDDPLRLGVKGKSKPSSGGTEGMIANVLRHLWDLVARPVKEDLDLRGLSEGRVWWCPTSHLFSLPIHAAGIADRDIHFCDYYISSYTASLSALINARKSASVTESTHKATTTSILLVGQPDTSIPDVRTEINYIQSLTSSSDVDVQSCIEDDALPSNVIRSLQSSACSWIHFACHGFVHPSNPFESYFQLHDRRKLTLVDLLNADLPNAELAFLAACHSAAGETSQRTPDESLHLASAMQFIGFRAVVGTLWAMADRDGPVIAEAFYEYMLRHGDVGGVRRFVTYRDSAAALHAATKVLRRKRVPLDRWVNFIHIGA